MPPLTFLVPLTGIEPVRILLRGILSPLCLPVPPQRLIHFFTDLRSVVPLSVCGARQPLRLSIQACVLPTAALAALALASATGGGQARGRDRTGTDFTPRDFKSLVSACSTTAACSPILPHLACFVK